MNDYSDEPYKIKKAAEKILEFIEKSGMRHQDDLEKTLGNGQISFSLKPDSGGSVTGIMGCSIDDVPVLSISINPILGYYQFTARTKRMMKYYDFEGMDEKKNIIQSRKIHYARDMNIMPSIKSDLEDIAKLND